MKISKALRSLRITLFAIPLLLSLSVQDSIAAAPADDARPVFMVSGLMRLKSNLAIVRLVQGTVVKSDSKEAIAAFTGDIDERFPDYELVDILIAPLTNKPGVIESPRQGAEFDLSWV